MTAHSTSPSLSRPLVPRSLAWSLAASLAFLAAPALAQPELAYSTYLGAPNDDFAYDVAYDAQGAAYVVGCSFLPPIFDFPFVTPAGNFFDGGAGLGGYDVFVTKISAAGEVVYSAVLGGPGDDCAHAVTVDAAGRAIVTGEAGVLFPLVDTIEAYQAVPEAFVAVLDPTGTEIEFSTYLSGDGDEDGTGIAVGGDGDVYVTGTTTSNQNSFVPTTPTFDDSFNGMVDGFLARIDLTGPLGPTIVFKTFLGTPGLDFATALAVGPQGHAYVVGQTDWPGKFDHAPDPQIQSMQGGGFDAFVLRINNGGFGSGFFTWLGGTATDVAKDVALSPAGEILVAGWTDSQTFPTQNPLQSYRGDRDAFLARIAPAGDELRSSTFWGGFMFDQGEALAVTPEGDVLLTGESDSANLPRTDDAIQRNLAGFEDVFVTRFSPEIDEVRFSTWLGGGSFDLPRGAAFHDGRLALAGQTFSAGADPFPVTDDAVMGSAPTPYNAFFSVIDFGGGAPVGEIHPADLDGDGRISLDEITGYGAAWKSGSPWPRPPSPIPIDYLTNAAALWQQGETYVDTGGAKPGGWQPAP